MHQYLDGDGSGTSATCVSSTIGQERIPAATQWLKSNGKLGIIGEFAGGANSRCETAAQVTWTQTRTSGLALCGGLLGHNGPIISTSRTAYNAYMNILNQCEEAGFQVWKLGQIIEVMKVLFLKFRSLPQRNFENVILYIRVVFHSER